MTWHFPAGRLPAEKSRDNYLFHDLNPFHIEIADTFSVAPGGVLVWRRGYTDASAGVEALYLIRCEQWKKAPPSTKAALHTLEQRRSGDVMVKDSTCTLKMIMENQTLFAAAWQAIATIDIWYSSLITLWQTARLHSEALSDRRVFIFRCKDERVMWLTSA